MPHLIGYLFKNMNRSAKKTKSPLRMDKCAFLTASTQKDEKEYLFQREEKLIQEKYISVLNR